MAPLPASLQRARAAAWRMERPAWEALGNQPAPVQAPDDGDPTARYHRPHYDPNEMPRMGEEAQRAPPTLEDMLLVDEYGPEGAAGVQAAEDVADFSGLGHVRRSAEGFTRGVLSGSPDLDAGWGQGWSNAGLAALNLAGTAGVVGDVASLGRTGSRFRFAGTPTRPPSREPLFPELGANDRGPLERTSALLRGEADSQESLYRSGVTRAWQGRTPAAEQLLDFDPQNPNRGTFEARRNSLEAIEPEEPVTPLPVHPPREIGPGGLPIAPRTPFRNSLRGSNDDLAEAAAPRADATPDARPASEGSLNTGNDGGSARTGLAFDRYEDFSGASAPALESPSPRVGGESTASEAGFDRGRVVYRGLGRQYDPANGGYYQSFTSSLADAQEYGPNVVAANLRLGRNLAVDGGGNNFNAISVSQLPAEVRARLHPSTGASVTTDQIAHAAREAGYDSVTVRNVHDTRWGERPRGQETRTIDFVFDTKNVAPLDHVPPQPIERGGAEKVKLSDSDRALLAELEADISPHAGSDGGSAGSGVLAQEPVAPRQRMERFALTPEREAQLRSRTRDLDENTPLDVRLRIDAHRQSRSMERAMAGIENWPPERVAEFYKLIERMNPIAAERMVEVLSRRVSELRMQEIFPGLNAGPKGSPAGTDPPPRPPRNETGGEPEGIYAPMVDGMPRPRGALSGWNDLPETPIRPSAGFDWDLPMLPLSRSSAPDRVIPPDARAGGFGGRMFRMSQVSELPWDDAGPPMLLARAQRFGTESSIDPRAILWGGVAASGPTGYATALGLQASRDWPTEVENEREDIALDRMEGLTAEQRQALWRLRNGTYESPYQRSAMIADYGLTAAQGQLPYGAQSPNDLYRRGALTQ